MLRVRTLCAIEDHQRRHALFEDVRSEIVEAAEGVKRMARGLRPPELEELGLVLALQAHARSLQEAIGFDVVADLGIVDPYLGMTAKLVVYRIVQEALSNVIRHGGVERAWIRVARVGDDIVAEVRDEGAGFAPGDVGGDHRGLGLIGMQERATMIGARLVIDAVPGKGTCVQVTVPIGGAVSQNA